MLSRRLLRKSAASLLCGAAAGIFSVANAQTAPADDPFASPAASAAATPATSASADPFAPSFGEAAPTTSAAAVVDPFAPAASAPVPAAVAMEPAAGAMDAGTAGAAHAEAEHFGGGGSHPSASPNANLITAVDVQTGAVEEPNPFGLAEKPADSAESTGSGIARVSRFRFVEAERPDGTRGVARKQMTKEEADAFDQKIFAFYHDLIDRGQLTSFNAATSTADDWAQWMAYSYQLRLWQQYCETIVLVGASFDASTANIKWPGAPAAVAPGQVAGGGVQGLSGGGGGKNDGGNEGGIGGGGAPPPPANIYNENRSLDNQLKDFNPLPDTRGGGQGRVVLDPKVMDDQAVTVYQSYLKTLRGYEKDQAKFMKDMAEGLDQREAARQAYRDWRANQLIIVKDFVNEWNRRYEGQVTTIAGVRYELYRPESAPTRTVRGANVVKTDFGLTPYDLLNEDGTLRGPAKQ
ncbi:hypothetical protein BH09SUM1_BH09SUM1_32810 [soil metagenome]